MPSPGAFLFITMLGLALLGRVFPAAAQEQDRPARATPMIREIEVDPLELEGKVVRFRPRNQRNDMVEFGHDVTIPAGSSVNNLVVIGGDAYVDGTVSGDLVVIGGSAVVKGEVRKETVVVLGGATFGPDALLERDFFIVGGPVLIDPKASLHGARHVITLDMIMPGFVWLRDWLSQGLFMGRPFPPQLPWAWAVAGCMAGICFLMSFLFPRTVQSCAVTLENQPVASFFTGILAFMLIAPLFLLLIVSVAGILVIPFAVCALVASLFLGKAAVYALGGQQIGRQFNLPDISTPVALLLGVVLFYLLYMLPALGFVVWGLTLLFGVGAAVLALFRNFRGEETPAAATVTVAAPASPAWTDSPPAGETAPPPMMGSEALVLRRVGFWRRFFATLLDFILIGLVVPLIGPFFLLLWSAYFIGMWAWKGTTIGGIVLGIKVIRTDGQPVDFAVALVRSLSSYFSAMALFLGFFWAGWDREKQAWHDKIAGTAVVRVPRGISLL